MLKAHGLLELFLCKKWYNGFCGCVLTDDSVEMNFQNGIILMNHVVIHVIAHNCV